MTIFLLNYKTNISNKQNDNKYEAFNKEKKSTN